MFENLQKDPRKPVIKDIAEAFARNYSLILNNSSGLQLLSELTSFYDIPMWVNLQVILLTNRKIIWKSFSLHSSQVKAQAYENFYEPYDIIAEPDNKAIGVGMSVIFYNINNRKFSSGVSSLGMMDESHNTISLSLGFFPFTPYFDILSRISSYLFEAGSMKKSFPHFYMQSNREKIEEAGPQVLTMEQLEIGFIIWLMAVVVSIIVFLLELAIKCGTLLYNHLKSSMIAFFIVKTHLKTHKFM